MFFSDNYPNGRISKASLNGENSTVIVFKSLIHVPSLSIDTENNNLYWTDVVRNTVEVCDYNGFNRRAITRINMNPMSGIQFYKVMHNVPRFYFQREKIIKNLVKIAWIRRYFSLVFEFKFNSIVIWNIALLFLILVFNMANSIV